MVLKINSKIARDEKMVSNSLTLRKSLSLNYSPDRSSSSRPEALTFSNPDYEATATDITGVNVTIDSDVLTEGSDMLGGTVSTFKREQKNTHSDNNIHSGQIKTGY